MVFLNKIRKAEIDGIKRLTGKKQIGLENHSVNLEAELVII